MTRDYPRTPLPHELEDAHARRRVEQRELSIARGAANARQARAHRIAGGAASGLVDKVRSFPETRGMADRLAKLVGRHEGLIRELAGLPEGVAGIDKQNEIIDSEIRIMEEYDRLMVKIYEPLHAALLSTRRDMDELERQILGISQTFDEWVERLCDMKDAASAYGAQCAQVDREYLHRNLDYGVSMSITSRERGTATFHPLRDIVKSDYLWYILRDLQE